MPLLFQKDVKDIRTNAGVQYPIRSGHTSATVIFPFLIKKLEPATPTSGESDYGLDRLEAIDLLDEVYDFVGYHSVTQYLKTHEYLIDLLLEAIPRISEIFPSGIHRTLAVAVDPEEDHDELRLTLHGGYEPEYLAHCLNEVDETWWVDAVPRARGELVVDIDYE